MFLELELAYTMVHLREPYDNYISKDDISKEVGTSYTSKNQFGLW